MGVDALTEALAAAEYRRQVGTWQNGYDAGYAAGLAEDDRTREACAGAVEALRNYGRHHPTRCAHIKDHTVACDCGWQKIVDDQGLEAPKEAEGA